MICYDDLHAAGTYVFDFAAVGNAAVHGDHQRGIALVYQPCERLLFHAVPFRAFGNVRGGVGAVFQKSAEKYGRSAHAVRIVIAEHENMPARRHRFVDERFEFAHARHQKRREKVRARRREKAFSLLLGVHAPRIKDPGGDLVQSARVCEPAYGIQLFLGVFVIPYESFHRVSFGNLCDCRNAKKGGK